ncbi:LCP family protein [Enterococcus sp. 669A]|uniref:Regulatory protein MsrR n=1 Tax=Candidatus Enterococcus moelleringii TaxID=2815325 RepID=A0ABS3LCB2_9ENTE|nr:LCP family protein [Enterococcus sp. 669A]MBO1307270.1 LCP family protein [Enterococcus sp. 669A]
MSRVDRYKKIHEESKKSERKASLVRREVKKPKREKEQPTEEPVFTHDTYEEPETNYSSEPKKSKPKLKMPAIKIPRWKRKAKRPEVYPTGKKPKKKRSIGRIILKVLVGLLIFSVVTFGIGNVMARTDSSIPGMETQEFNGVDSADGTKNILLLGSDTRDNETGRADSMMILQVDGSGKTKLVSFMRDMYVTIPGVGDNKLNAAYAYGGADLVRQTIKENFGVDCRYYAMVDFQSFEKGVDALFPRGVPIEAEKDMSSYIDEPISQGMQRMNGHTLLNYARFRMDEEGDFGRVRRQQQVIQTVFGQLKNPLVLLRGPYAAGKIFGYLSTDMGTGFLVANTFNFAKTAMGVDRLTLPVDGSWSYGDTYDAGSVLFVDFASNAQAVQSFLAK